MSVLDRFLLILLSVLSVLAAVFAIMFVFGGLASAGYVLSQRLDVTICVIAIVYALIAIRFFFYRWGPPKVDSVVLPGDYGQIRISFDTFRQIANRAGRSIRGVHEFETRVATGSTGIWLAARVKALPDYDLARVSTDVQQAVKTSIEQTTGVTVERVTVSIVELAANGGKSARTWVE